MLFELLLTSGQYLNLLDISADLYFVSTTVWPLTSATIGLTWLTQFASIIVGVFGLLLTQLQLLFNIKLISYAVLNTAFKFIVLIALLIFVRGGIPRYRYDFLTKVGWIKFLSLILSIFLSTLLLLFLF